MKKIKGIMTIMVILIILLSVNSCAPKWAKTYGGTDDERASSIQQTADGGYIVAGESLSFGAGGHDVWILKLDGGGDIQWQKTYGGTESDEAYSIQQTNDGGYIVAQGSPTEIVKSSESLTAEFLRCR